ncbi:hypothetical protein EWM64_g7896, partial [Hericium alpestre]
MSELDADLYGDLYGPDDGEFAAEPPKESIKQEAQEPTPTTSVSPAPSKPTVSAATAAKEEEVPFKKSPPPAPIPVVSLAPTVDTMPQTAPRPPSPVTQQIPTYQERSENGYPQGVPYTPQEGGYGATAVGTERSVRPSEMKDEGQEHQRATKLFIGGLAGSVTSESMREFFSQFGKVVDSTVMLDRETGRSKGFGFVSFEDTDVSPFLGFGNLEIDGKLIDVKLAQPRSQRDFDSGGGGGGAGRGAGGAYG